MSLQTNEEIELGEFKISQSGSTVLTIGNLGSSIALFLYDAETRIGGLAHVALPDSTINLGDISENRPAKYADRGVPLLVEAFLEAGGKKPSTRVKMMGGSQLFNFGGGGGNFLNIGARNIISVRAALARHGFGVHKTDTGGNRGRAARFIIATGQVYVKRIGQGDFGEL